MTARRRSPGEGGAYSYRTGAGERWYWKATVTRPDGGTFVKVQRGFTTKKAALDDMRDALSDSAKTGYVDPSKQKFGDYLTEWLDGLRLADSTVASYRRNVTHHVTPYLGNVPLASVTATRLDKLYRQLERGGRADHKKGEGLSYRTVRYVHNIISAALAAAVKAKMLKVNPAADANPPTAKQAAAPEMRCWTAAQLATFLDWSAGQSGMHAAWYSLAMTGMRRGELLALRWRDLDLTAGTATIGRSVEVIRQKGKGARLVIGPTKSGKIRVIDIDGQTVTVLREWRRARGSLALPLATDEGLVFGSVNGGIRHPEHFTDLWRETVARCRRDLGDGAPPLIRLHDLRHTHATLMLSAGEDVKLVSERLGHASAVVTLTIYSHVLPGRQREAAHRLAERVAEARTS